eukprot:TRINITY_DN18340_c0_g1_i1.p1 TRINITY_DN18340_c0_g1~~TRINITY_DN18340_c0_g1_i1.p1  ORF type:complete len:834 (+),score=135.68 TRINITY_DN18340_c0_g1_i1:456-2957(+)
MDLFAHSTRSPKTRPKDLALWHGARLTHHGPQVVVSLLRLLVDCVALRGLRLSGGCAPWLVGGWCWSICVLVKRARKTASASTRECAHVPGAAGSRRLDAAYATFLYGLLVYSTVIAWCNTTLEPTQGSASLGIGTKGAMATLLFLCESWVMLQHTNIFGNPCCQSLDRRTGIDLLQRDQFWVVAEVLSLYWAREVVMMVAYVTFFAPPGSWLVVPVGVSAIYHLVKIHFVCVDAQRQWSDGVMRALIDNFHGGVIETLGRLALQGGDTILHVLLVAEMRTSALIPAPDVLLHVLFAAWLAHACGNQLSSQSTATLPIELVKRVDMGPALKSALVLGLQLTAFLYQPVLHVVLLPWMIVADDHDAKPGTKPLHDKSGDGQCTVCHLLSRHRPRDSPAAVFLGMGTLMHGIQLLATDRVNSPTWSQNRSFALVPSWLQIGFSAITAFYLLVGTYVLGAKPIVMERFVHAGLDVQTWVTVGFGAMFVLAPKKVAREIEQLAGAAVDKGVKVFGLGALCKAEFVNRNGVDVVLALDKKYPSRQTRVVHGNTLTAATVATRIDQVLAHVADAAPKHVFITGATSSIGVALAKHLVEQHVHVHALSGAPRRLAEIRAGLPADLCDYFHSHSSIADGLAFSVWVIGKFDTRVLSFMPREAVAIVFSVPSPFDAGSSKERRPDVLAVEAGVMRIRNQDPAFRGGYPCGLRSDELYACHAATIVAAHSPDPQDEVGDVDPDDMTPQLNAAAALGIRLSDLALDVEAELARRLGGNTESACAGHRDIVVVGAGVCGLTVGASISKASGSHTLGVLAVSYTHLRAHETVLDLVCRLLLEKKKK